MARILITLNPGALTLFGDFTNCRLDMKSAGSYVRGSGKLFTIRPCRKLHATSVGTKRVGDQMVIDNNDGPLVDRVSGELTLPTPGFYELADRGYGYHAFVVVPELIDDLPSVTVADYTGPDLGVAPVDTGNTAPESGDHVALSADELREAGDPERPGNNVEGGDVTSETSLYTIEAAAEKLGITVEVLKKRISKGTVDVEVGEDDARMVRM